MRITENELRRIIRQVILEEAAINEAGFMSDLADKGRTALGIGAMAAAAKFGGLGGMSTSHAQKPGYEQQYEQNKALEELESLLESLIEIDDYEKTFPDLPWEKLNSLGDSRTIERELFLGKNSFFRVVYNMAISAGAGKTKATGMAHQKTLELQHLMQGSKGLNPK